MATMAELTSQVCWLKAWLTEMAAFGKHIQKPMGLHMENKFKAHGGGPVEKTLKAHGAAHENKQIMKAH